MILLSGALCPVHAADYYLTVSGAGAKDGSSWANAYDVSSLWTVVNTTMQPGDTLYLGGPDTSGGATYGDNRLTITSSGTAAAPKSLVGVDRGYGLPQFIGIQSTRSYTTITLADTVSYWTIKNLYIAHRDMGIATSGGGHLSMVIDGVTVHDIRSKGYSFTDCDDLLVQNCLAERYTEIGFMCNNSCDGVAFKNCVADCTGTGDVDDPAWKATVDSPVGFNFNSKGSTAAPNTDILLEDCEALNNDEDTADTGDYEQGDGFKTEDGNVGMTFLRCLSHANQDGAFDLKGSRQTLQDCKAVNNSRYGFKIWYDATLINCIAVNNGARQFTFAALNTGNTVTAEHCTFHCAGTSQVGAVIETAGNTLEMDDCIISFAGSSGTYTAGSGAFSLVHTSKLANTSNTANSPQSINPVIPWDGSGNDYDNLTYGTTRGYNSAGYTGDGGGGTGVATGTLPEADTYVWDGSPGTNYGADTGLVVKQGSSGYNRISYLRFSIPDGGTVLSATLHLKVITAGSSPATVEIRELGNDSWSETGMTWSSRASSTGTLIASIDASTAGQDYSIDVSNYVSQEAAGDGRVSFVLVQPSGVGQYVTFGSRENTGNEPVLDLQ